MQDLLTTRRHRFDALFALLTGTRVAGLPRDPRLRRDIGLPPRLTAPHERPLTPTPFGPAIPR